MSNFCCISINYLTSLEMRALSLTIYDIMQKDTHGLIR